MVAVEEHALFSHLTDHMPVALHEAHTLCPHEDEQFNAVTSADSRWESSGHGTHPDAALRHPICGQVLLLLPSLC